MAFVVLEKGDVQTDAEDVLIPSINALESNYPNPFNPSTTIRFSLAGPGHASLRIYDVSGRLVRSLVNGTVDSGPHEILWDGTNDRGAGTASGVYFYRLVTDRYAETKRMVLLR
jgi:hypothetical protein